MNASFTTLLQNTKTANDPRAMYVFVKAANEKLQGNIRKAQFISCMPGRADEAHNYFENIIPGWQATVNEINKIWTHAVIDMSVNQIVSIMSEEREEA